MLSRNTNPTCNTKCGSNIVPTGMKNRYKQGRVYILVYTSLILYTNFNMQCKIFIHINNFPDALQIL